MIWITRKIIAGVITSTYLISLGIPCERRRRIHMVFKARKDNNGEVDENINRSGRIKGSAEMSRRSLKERELISLLRKIKPHMSDSIMTAARIMKNDESNDANKLKASALLISVYKELLKDAYDGDEEAEGTEIQSNTPIFSLKIVGEDKSKD